MSKRETTIDRKIEKVHNKVKIITTRVTTFTLSYPKEVKEQIEVLKKALKKNEMQAELNNKERETLLKFLKEYESIK